MIRRQIGILGAALLFGVGTARVSLAQEQAMGPAASETTPAKHNPSSSADAPPEGNVVSKTSQRTQTGLVRRFVDDQRRVWTSPAKIRFTDADWLVPLSGITAGPLLSNRDFSKHLLQRPATITPYKRQSNARVGALIGGDRARDGRR